MKNDAIDSDALLLPEQAAKILNIKVATLNKCRCTGEHNIPYVKIGRTVRYQRSALAAYIAKHVVGG